ncbi:MAG: fatty-acid oxidation protein subunit alpha [Alphaproteobacteria bacterium]|nr:fatty-acid oxidation protein subunit alpha [Alphaproteobacteria bacterium]
MTIKTAFKLAIKQDGIATLTFSLPESKVNILRSDILLELNQLIDEIAKNKDIKLLIFRSAKEDNFIAGADINEIKSINSEEDALKIVKQGQDILTNLANLKCITLAYINGSSLGGGTELALACDFRIAAASAKVQIGLPEVNLGIIPGFGGTQRLPRLIGIIKSLPMILTGKAVNYKKAYKIGLIDDYFPEEFAESNINSFVKNILSSNYRDKLIKRRATRPFIEKVNLFDDIIFEKAKKNIIKKTKGHYPAPLAALKLVANSYNESLTKGLDMELESFAKLVTGDICKNLISLYYTNEKIKKDNGVKQKIAEIEIKRAAVVGAGVMGGGIAWLYSNIDIPVRMRDITTNALALGFKQVNKIYRQLLKIRKYNKNQITNKLALISATTEMVGFKSCDIVSEAVIENLDIKKMVALEIEKNVDKKCIIASNTSSISITEMAKDLKYPERFIGLHFFNPVNKMPLVEIIAGKKTNKETIASVVKLAKRAKKTPIVVADCAGFLVNRILLTYINEAFYILQEIGDAKRIDNVIEKFGMPMGPFILADTVGLDVGYKVAKILEDAYGQRMLVSKLIDQLYNNKKLLGKKSGAGIYLYQGKKVTCNFAINSLCNKNEITDGEIQDRLILVMINEAARCLEEKVVDSAEYLDMAMIMGTGFPAFRGGLLRYADKLSIADLIDKLNKLSDQYGDKFSPANLLLKMKKEQTKFYN